MADDAQTVITLLTWTGSPPTATPVPFYATKDTAGNYSLQSTPRVMGAQVDTGNPMPVTDAAAETALATIATNTGAGATAANQTAAHTVLAELLAALTGTLETQLAAGSAAIGTVGVTALPPLPAGTNTIGAVVSPSGAGTDASGSPPATLTELATFTVATPGAYYVQNQSAAPIQVELDNGTSGGTIILLSSGGSAGAQGADTSPALPWFVGRVRVFGAAGSQFAARSN